MSGQVNVEELLATAEQLKDYIDNLQESLSEMTENLAAIESSKSILSEGVKGEAMVSLDRKNYIMAKSQGIETSNVLVYLGLAYYALVPKDQAIKVLEKRENLVKETMQSIQSELAKAINQYNEVATILNSMRGGNEQPQ